jgi:hypothetical protein
VQTNTRQLIVHAALATCQLPGDTSQPTSTYVAVAGATTVRPLVPLLLLLLLLGWLLLWLPHCVGNPAWCVESHNSQWDNLQQQ